MLDRADSLDGAHIAARKAANTFAQLGEPALADDTGLSIHGWNGLPGALVAWVLDTVGPHAILDMAAGLTDRRATLTTAPRLGRRHRRPRLPGNRDRLPATRPRGTSGFGYDAIFISDSDSSHRTYAQMTSC